MKRSRFLIPLVAAGGLFLAAPARSAIQLPPLGDVLQNTQFRIPGIGIEVSAEDIAGLIQNTGGYLDFLRQQILGSLSQEFCNGGPTCPHDDLLETVIGPLGLPDPQAVEAVIYEILDREANGTEESGGAFGVNAATYSLLRQQDLEAAAADAFAEVTTGTDGQQRILEEQIEVTEIVTGGIELAVQAQDEVITQNVMKLMMQQSAQDMVLTRMLHNEMAQQRLATAWNIEVANDMRQQFNQAERERQFQSTRSVVDAYGAFLTLSATVGDGEQP